MLSTLIVIKQCLMVNDNRLLKKYAKMQERVSILMNIEFDSEPVYDDNDT